MANGNCQTFGQGQGGVDRVQAHSRSRRERVRRQHPGNGGRCKGNAFGGRTSLRCLVVRTMAGPPRMGRRQLDRSRRLRSPGRFGPHRGVHRQGERPSHHRRRGPQHPPRLWGLRQPILGSALPDGIRQDGGLGTTIRGATASQWEAGRPLAGRAAAETARTSRRTTPLGRSRKPLPGSWTSYSRPDDSTSP